ncbi:AraC family transcriptional regulator [Gracilibacillus sp. S3-1-1]|uniref:AraC family transcriptional regulator n=1 Tax=Gracilibacillus pellucidus TaxID=3095368 RepID=A0ACC6M455_9BACI|nr:AraC family transcriptional regulator [Gracilibacillus sp. S3-1-1]MDX8045749.1 AraC family transcriptional regulator [Gracilibacillus sp. S3-1-1]
MGELSVPVQDEYVPGFLIQDKKEPSQMPIYHRHVGYEIVWLKEGEAMYMFEEKVYRLRKNAILLFKSSEFHRVSLKEGATYERIVVMFTEDFLPDSHPIYQTFSSFLEQLSSPHFLLNLFVWQTEKLQVITDNLLLEHRQQDSWKQKEAIELYLLELLLFICREVKNEHKDILYQKIEQHQNKKMAVHDRLIKEINDVWNTDWRLDNIAAKLHMSKYYVSHFFKEEFGVTIQEYILQRRVFEANKLLSETDIPIHQIAEYVGFMSASSFNRRYKEKTGITPNQYRKNNKHFET